MSYHYTEGRFTGSLSPHYPALNGIVFELRIVGVLLRGVVKSTRGPVPAVLPANRRYGVFRNTQANPLRLLITSSET
jgi:hypothetical protein